MTGEKMAKTDWILTEPEEKRVRCKEKESVN